MNGGIARHSRGEDPLEGLQTRLFDAVIPVSPGDSGDGVEDEVAPVEALHLHLVYTSYKITSVYGVRLSPVDRPRGRPPTGRNVQDLFVGGSHRGGWSKRPSAPSYRSRRFAPRFRAMVIRSRTYSKGTFRDRGLSARFCTNFNEVTVVIQVPSIVSTDGASGRASRLPHSGPLRSFGPEGGTREPTSRVSPGVSRTATVRWSRARRNGFSRVSEPGLDGSSRLSVRVHSVAQLGRIRIGGPLGGIRPATRRTTAPPRDA